MRVISSKCSVKTPNISSRKRRTKNSRSREAEIKTARPFECFNSRLLVISENPFAEVETGIESWIMQWTDIGEYIAVSTSQSVRNADHCRISTYIESSDIDMRLLYHFQCTRWCDKELRIELRSGSSEMRGEMHLHVMATYLTAKSHLMGDLIDVWIHWKEPFGNKGFCQEYLKVK